MKHVIALLILLITTSCARKVAVHPPQLIKVGNYSYIKDVDGRLYIVTTNTRDFDEAMKKIHPGPSSVSKLNLWVITPLERGKHK